MALKRILQRNHQNEENYHLICDKYDKASSTCLSLTARIDHVILMDIWYNTPQGKAELTKAQTVFSCELLPGGCHNCQTTFMCLHCDTVCLLSGHRAHNLCVMHFKESSRDKYTCKYSNSCKCTRTVGRNKRTKNGRKKCMSPWYESAHFMECNCCVL
jgi:hypothetical protein